MQPQPLPTEVQMGLAKPSEGGDMMVTIEFSTPAGVQVYFLAPDAAQQIGEAMVQAGKQASSQLFTPPKQSLIVPQ